MVNYAATRAGSIESLNASMRRTLVTDEDLISLCHLKADIIARSKVIELSRIVVHRELSVMPEYDVKNTEMQNARRQAKEEVEAARAAAENAQTAVNDQQHQIRGAERSKSGNRGDI